MRIGKWSIVCAAATLALVAPTIVCAQGNAAPQGQRGGRGGRGGGGRALTLASVPPEALRGELNLSSSQVAQIKTLHDKYTETMRSMRPAPGSPPDPAARDQMRTLAQQTSGSIEAILTPSQKAAAPKALQELTLLRTAGIPLQALDEIKLTGSQKQQIKAGAQDAMQKIRAASPDQRRALMQQARQDLRAKTMSLLSDSQKAVVEKYGRGGRGRNRGQGGANTST